MTATTAPITTGRPFTWLSLPARARPTPSGWHQSHQHWAAPPSSPPPQASALARLSRTTGWAPPSSPPPQASALARLATSTRTRGLRSPVPELRQADEFQPVVAEVVDVAVGHQQHLGRCELRDELGVVADEHDRALPRRQIGRAHV